MYRNPGNLFAQRSRERRGEKRRKINTRGGSLSMQQLDLFTGEEGTMPRNDKGWKPGPCKLARYLLSARYKSVGKPSLTKSTLRNQNWGGKGVGEGNGGRGWRRRVCGGYRCEMFPWGGPGRKESHPSIQTSRNDPLTGQYVSRLSLRQPPDIRLYVLSCKATDLCERESSQSSLSLSFSLSVRVAFLFFFFLTFSRLLIDF